MKIRITRTEVAATFLIVAAAGTLFIAYFVFGPGPMAFAGGTPIELSDYHQGLLTGAPPQYANAPLLERGQYLARAADCEACHTQKNGTPFAGGRAFVLPNFGTLFTPNITPDRATGIGNWSDAEFLRAVHEGIGRDGKRLYPAFPYASYTALTDADVLAIKAYLFSLPPVHLEAPKNKLVFPFNQRWLMAIWSAMFNPNQRFKPVAERSAQWNRGAYLVEAAAHCGECHTPRNILQAMNNRRKFAGGVAEGWNAYNISSDPAAGIGAWSNADLQKYLSAGFAPGRGTASGPMREAVHLSTRYLTEDDIAAMVAYLRSVPAHPSSELPPLSPAASANPAVGPTGNAIGKRLFEGACASCHAWNGTGAIVEEARLTGMRAVNDPSAANVARMILDGTGKPGTGETYMPSFASTYSDKEIAAVANYVTARFGRTTSNVDAKDVAVMRAGK